MCDKNSIENESFTLMASEIASYITPSDLDNFHNQKKPFDTNKMPQKLFRGFKLDPQIDMQECKLDDNNICALCSTKSEDSFVFDKKQLEGILIKDTIFGVCPVDILSDTCYDLSLKNFHDSSKREMKDN